MLSYLDKDGTFELPTGWHEVTTRQYLDLDRLKLATVEARASYFAGRPIQVNGDVANTLAFLLYEPPTEGGLAYPLDLGQETFLQVESIRALLVTQPLHQCYGLVYAAFKGRYDNWGAAEFNQARSYVYAERCLDFSTADTYPAVKHCLSELARLSEKYAYLSEPDRTEAGQKARAAGSDRLGIFTHLNVARHYAERFGVTVDAVYNWPYETVALYLYQDKLQAEVSDQMQQNSKNAS